MIKQITLLLFFLIPLLSAESKYQTQLMQDQKDIIMKVGDGKGFTIVQIHPRKHFINLRIERREGHPIFITNRCQLFQRRACIDQMDRLNQMRIVGRTQIVQLQYCANCIVLIKVMQDKGNISIRMSINPQRQIHGYIVDRMSKASTIKYQCKPSQSGYFYVYSGKATLSSIQNQSQISTSKDTQLSFIHNTTDNLQVHCQSACSYILSLQSALHDGLMSASQISTSHPMTFNITQGYILIATPMNQLKHITIKVSQIHTTQSKQKPSHIVIHPKYLLTLTGMHTQSLHLPYEDGLVYQVQMNSSVKTDVMVLSSVSEVILLPIGVAIPHSLNANQSQIYISQGRQRGEELLISVGACASGQIIIFVGEDIGNMTEIHMQNLIYIPWVMASSTLIINITTSNYAHYRIQMIGNKDNKSLYSTRVYADDNRSYSYDTSVTSNLEQDNSLTLMFKEHLRKGKYYFISGNNVNAVMKEGYCPRHLFQMQSRLQDVSALEIFPSQLQSDTSLLHLSIQLQRHHHSYAVIMVITPDGQTMGYDHINLEDIKQYSTMRYPLYNVFLFMTLAAIVSVSCVMSLKKRRTFKIGGYTALDAPSQESL